MDTLWVFAVVIGVVAGDVGLGYHYKVPQTSYGVPTYQGSAGSSGYNNGLGVGSGSNYNQYAGGLGSGSNYFATQSGLGQSTVAQSSIGQSTLGQSSIGQTSGLPSGELSSVFGQNTGYVSGFQSTGNAASAAAGAEANKNFFQSGFIQPTYQTGDYSAFNQFQSSQYQASAADKYQQYYDVIQQQPAQVFKHYYVHAAPEEPESPKSRQPIVLPPPQKHYKIIFIKAPSTPAQAPQIIPVQSQNEEKTIVYVLVKKPEDAQNIVLPKIEQKPPTKPEVYFIKYNNKQDSQAVINDIVSDLNKGGGANVGYSAVDASNQGSVSAGPFGQGLSLSENQGSSSNFDSSSSLGSATFGSGLGSSSAFSSVTSAPTSFDSNSGGSSGTFGSSFGSSSNGFGVYDGAKGQTLAVSTVDGGSDSGYDSSSGSSVSSTASTIGGYDASAISTSQGIPHESYGPPKFKVL
ncbi:unnamed protein product, partial [Iphiclides podalirius]